MALSAIILAGGKSSRMGQDKGLMNYKGYPMVHHVIETCRMFTDKIFISTNNLQYAAFGYPLIQDNYKNVGPMGGLEASLKLSATEDNIVCPCDMPNIQPELVEAVLEKKNGNLAVVLKDRKGKLVPVFGYYNKLVLPVIRDHIKTGNFRMQSLLDILKAEAVVVSSDEMLANINFREDLR